MTKGFKQGDIVPNSSSYQKMIETKKIRGFEIVRQAFRQHPTEKPILPARKTTSAMAYDFVALENITIQPGEVHAFATDIKAYMQEDECLILNARSSVGFKKHCRLVNVSGWIDSDFYSNPDNDGNIGIGLYNFGKKPVSFVIGERIAQGAFFKFLTKDNDDADLKVKRTGGIGSTGTK